MVPSKSVRKIRLALVLLLFLIGTSSAPSLAPSAAAGLVAAYGFNEGSGISAGDASGNGHIGAIAGATWTPQGRFGSALAFNGVDNWLTVNDGPALDLTTGMTLEAWVLPTALGTAWRNVIIKERPGGEVYNLYANVDSLQPTIYVVGASAPGSPAEARGGPQLPVNAWSHLAATYDGATLRLFVNGSQVSSRVLAGALLTSAGALRIGGNSIWGEFFQGRIDEVRIYNHALTPPEIQADMNTPVDGAVSGAPSVAITAPSDGVTVAGVVTITASATDDVGVVGVQFLLDGANLGVELTSAPYSLSWDTTTVQAGLHTLAARARDGDGHLRASPAVSVTVASDPGPGAFYDEVVVGAGLTFPTAFEFLPDGRMVITEFQGRVLVVQPGASAVDPAPVMELPNIIDEDVTVGGERGLVNVVADPAFATNGYIYLFYTAAIPQRDRVSRFTMTGNTADPGSELIVWQGAADSTSTDHHGGGLAFGPDGKLYISTGDNGNPPSVQSLTSDHGKILRVNKDGTVPGDNPFFDGAGPNIDAIWARGLRNPYRFSFDATNGRMYIGDVGLDSIEEVNIGAAGANYGWPSCEGPCGNAGMTAPIFSYSHAGRDAAVTGGFVYRGSQFPASHQGVYFYGDFAQNWIRYLTLDASGNVTGNMDFLPPDGALDGPVDPVMLKPGPDGALYYVDFGWGWQATVNPASIRRIRYISGDQPPVAVVSATPQAGPVPLSVSFSSSGSVDRDGDPLSYTWTFGDGTTSNEPHPVHVYARSGVYTAQLALSDGTTTVLSQILTISAGSPPQVAVTSPVNGLTFRAGDVINFSGTASDPDDGPLPAAAYAWTIVFHHDGHIHPTLGPVSGLTAGTFTIPSTGHDFSGATSYEIFLTATDSTGLQSTRSVFVYPQKASVTFLTSPAGLTINVDGVSTPTPYVMDTVTGFQHTVDAPNQTHDSVAYVFAAWSDGGAQVHSVIVGEAADTYTATYQATTVTKFPTSTTVVTGTLASGSATALASDDNTYYAVSSTTTGTRTAAWYGAFSAVPNEVTSLRVSYKGNNSRSCTQTVAIWSWTASAWVQLDSRTVGTAEVAINNLVPGGTLADYMSGATGSGEVRVRIRCQAAANLTSRGDVMSIVYGVPVGPPPSDTTPPVRSNGGPSGSLPAGTTQTSLSLATNESAQCRYGTTAGEAYASMPSVFPITGGTAHSTTVGGLSNGGSYTYVVRCADSSGNQNSDDFTISFSVGAPAAAGLVAAYGFNEGSGTSAGDASGNGHIGAISGATWTSQGRFGSALAFNGVDNWLTVNDGPALDLTTGMTLEAWVLPTALGSAWRNVIIKERPGGEVYNLYANVDSLQPTTYVVGASAPGSPVEARGGPQLPANVWSHLAATYDGATLRLFVNGSQVSSRVLAGALLTSAGALRIGGNSIWGEFFQGSIDEVRIYNRALTPAEIQADMNSPLN